MGEASRQRNHGKRATMPNLWLRMGLRRVLAVMSAYTADRFTVGHSNEERMYYFIVAFLKLLPQKLSILDALSCILSVSTPSSALRR